MKQSVIMQCHGLRYAAHRDSIGSPTEMTEAEYPSLGPAPAPKLAAASPAKDAPAAVQWASIAASPQRAGAQNQPQGDWAQADVADAPRVQQPRGSMHQERHQQQPQHVHRNEQGQQGMARPWAARAASSGRQPGTAPPAAASVHGAADQVAGRAPSDSSEDEDTVMADLLSGLDVTSHADVPGAPGNASAV